MPERLQKIVQPVKSRWVALTKDQKIRTVATAFIVAAALGLTLFFTLRTRYVSFVDNLNGNDLMSIESVLTDKGIKTQRKNNATELWVDEKQMGNAKLAVSTSNELSNIPFMFTDAVDRMGMGTTESTRRLLVIESKRSQLGRELTRFDGVTDASVFLEIPETFRLFSQDERKSTANALLTTSRKLTKQEGEQMARYLARGVEGLELENIEITDQDYNTVYSGKLESSAETGHGSLAEVKEQERVMVINMLRGMFLPLWDGVQVTPNLVYDNTTLTETKAIEYVPPANGDTGMPATEKTSSSSAKGMSPADAPGTDSNDAQSPSYDTGSSANSSFQQKESEIARIYDQHETFVTQGPGSYLRPTSSIALGFYRNKHYYQEQKEQETPGFSQTDWEAFKTSTYSQAVTDDPGIDLSRSTVATATGISKDAVSVTVWEVPVFHDALKNPIDWPTIIALGLVALLLLMLAYALIRRQKQEEEEEVEPELSVEDLLVSTQLEEAKEESEKLEEISVANESEIKKQIEKFINEKPEAVAALLRNWLNTEEW